MKALFFLILLFLPVDSWPFGASILREFGVRPSNFFLLIVLIFISLKTYDSKNILTKSMPLPFKNILYIFISLLALNILVLATEFLFSSVTEVQLTKGFLQFLLVLWFFISIFLWKILFQNLKIESTGYKYFMKCMILCALINLVFFGLDFFNSNIVFISEINNFLFFFRGEHDLRVSGLSSEPSTYASWVLLVWPLLLFTKKSLISNFERFLSISIGVACLISGLISGSRTFLLIFLFQSMLFLVVMPKKTSRGWLRSASLGSLAALIVILAILSFSAESEFFLLQLISILDIENNDSSITRLGSAYTAFNILIDHWIFGVGIGQFTYNYAQYVPNWALASSEVQAYISGDTENRINAFNLFLRIGAEMGLAALFFFFYFLLKIFKNAYLLIMSSRNDTLWSIGILISSLGGLSFWMQQDLFSYQPGIFSLGLILYLSEISLIGKQNFNV